MSQESNTTLDQCLRAVWRRTQRGYATGALLAFARWFVPLFLVVILIDRLAYLPGWLRAVAALSLLAVALRQAWFHGGSRLRRFDATLTAQQVEHAQGGLDSLLVTALQFQKQGASPGTSAAMWEHSQRKAQEVARYIVPREVVPMTALKRPLRIALSIAGLLLIFALLNGSFLAAGLGRLFTPWLAIAYPTDTKIHLGSGEMVIQEGAPASVEIRLSGRSRRPPNSRCAPAKASRAKSISRSSIRSAPTKSPRPRAISATASMPAMPAAAGARCA